MTQNTEVLSDSMRSQLEAWQERYKGRPEIELRQLLVLALEREEIVAVGYRKAMIERRLQSMRIDQSVKEIIRHAMTWIWQDEAMHVIYARGSIKQLNQPLLTARATFREVQGIIGGWAGAMEQHVRFREAPVARTVSRLTTLVGTVTGAVPKEVREYLRVRPFKDYCLFNVAAEKTASLVYERLLTIARDILHFPDQILLDLQRVRDEEYRHEHVFGIFAASLTAQDALSPAWNHDRLVDEIAAVSPFFLAPRFRSIPSGHPATVGSGGPVIVRQGSSAEERDPVFRSALDSSALKEALHKRCLQLGKSIAELTVVIKPTFMMMYSHRDRSPAVDPAVLIGLGRYLNELGVRFITVIESSKVYENFFHNRNVSFIAKEFGYESPDYIVHDCSENLESHQFARGLGETKISSVWKNGDFRINLSKMRSHPIERALLTLPNLEGLGRRWTDFMFSEREATYRTAILMMHDAFPANFSILDAYSNAPDGPLGVMGSTKPQHPFRFYVAEDPLSLDIVAAGHMGMVDPLESPMIQSAVYWFGDPSDRLFVDGPNEKLSNWHGPCHNDLSAFFSLAAEISYRHVSGRGSLFVPQMDPSLFAPIGEPSISIRVARGAIQRMFGLNHG